MLFSMNNNLAFPDGTKFYLDVKDGKYFNTDPARGADTFNPFNPFYLVQRFNYCAICTPT